MLCARILNTAGVVLTVAGCVLLYRFGLPPDFDPLGRSFIIASDRDETEKLKGDRYRFWGRTGIVLIAAGSLLQLLATWVA